MSVATKPIRRAATTLVFLLAFVLNPALLSGCRKDFDFGEREMVQLLETVNRAEPFEFEYEGGRYELTVTLKQKSGDDTTETVSRANVSPMRVAHACGERTFLRSANACLDITELPVDGTLKLRRVDAPASTPVAAFNIDGELTVEGKSLRSGSIMLYKGEQVVSLHSADAATFTLRRLRLDGVKFSQR